MGRQSGDLVGGKRVKRWILLLAAASGTLTGQMAVAQAVLSGSAGASEASQLNRQAVALLGEGRYGEAESLFRRAIELSERLFGPDHPNTMSSVVGLAATYQRQRRFAEAEPLYRRALAATEQNFGQEHPETLSLVEALTRLYADQQRAADAEPLFRRLWTARQRAVGNEHPDSLRAEFGLAATLVLQGRLAEAEPLLLHVLNARRRVLGPDHPDTLYAVNNLAILYRRQGRYAEAEPLLRQSLEAGQRVNGSEHPDTLTSISNLAQLYEAQGRYDEAERLQLRALQLRERVLGPDHHDTLSSVANLAALYQRLGRYTEAEPLHRRALEIRERTLGGEHPDTLTSINNLAILYEAQGRYAEAETLLRQVLETRERVLGRENPDTLSSANNLATLFLHRGRYAEAEPLFRNVLATRERLLGRSHPATFTSLNNLASLYQYQGRLAEAEPLRRRALEISENTLGREHPDTLVAVDNLASIYTLLGRYAEARSLLGRALEAQRRILGPAHPDTILSAEALSAAILSQSAAGSEALAPARLMLAGTRVRRTLGGSSQQARAQREREAGSAATRFSLFADAAWSAASGGGDRAALRADAFEALQDSLSGPADRSVAEQAARRYASGQNADLADVIRERWQLEQEWDRVDAELAQSFGAGSGEQQHTAALARLEAIQVRIAAIDGRLRSQAPEYFALTHPAPLDVAAAQRLLRPDEAILLVVPSRFGTHVVAVTADAIEWRRSDWDAGRIRAAVERLRRDIDPDRQSGASDRWAFDRNTAHQLHQQLVAPVAPLLAGRGRVFVAAGGALSALPFSVLVSATPQGADDDPDALRATHWFGDDVALVHIPSIQSLALLRRARTTGRRGGFFGVGDPSLDGESIQRARGAAFDPPTADQVFQPGRTRDGGSLVNLSTLRRLPRLPGTARELEAVRATLDAPEASVLLGARATESNVRAADLSRTGVLLFSTHGLTMAEGNIVGAGEPGLVLTPPSVARNGDDGFLAASEVTTLRLDADWVILSACNTATGDGGVSTGLGGLARAFFYAGARNLLASHWKVSDDVAPVLITRTLALERSGTSRAEAFRQAMREVRMDAAHDGPTASWAHPFFWAPFVLIGEGGS